MQFDVAPCLVYRMSLRSAKRGYVPSYTLGALVVCWAGSRDCRMPNIRVHGVGFKGCSAHDADPSLVNHSCGMMAQTQMEALRLSTTQTSRRRASP